MGTDFDESTITIVRHYNEHPEQYSDVDIEIVSEYISNGQDELAVQYLAQKRNDTGVPVSSCSLPDLVELSQEYREDDGSKLPSRRQFLKTAGRFGAGIFIADSAANIGGQVWYDQSRFHHPPGDIGNLQLIQKVLDGQPVSIDIHNLYLDETAENQESSYGREVAASVETVQSDLVDVSVRAQYSTSSPTTEEWKTVTDGISPDQVALDDAESIFSFILAFHTYRENTDADVTAVISDFKGNHSGVSGGIGTVLIERNNADRDADIINHEIGHELGLPHTLFSFDVMSYSVLAHNASHLTTVPYSPESQFNWDQIRDNLDQA